MFADHITVHVDYAQWTTNELLEFVNLAGQYRIQSQYRKTNCTSTEKQLIRTWKLKKPITVITFSKSNMYRINLPKKKYARPLPENSKY